MVSPERQRHAEKKHTPKDYIVARLAMAIGSLGFLGGIVDLSYYNNQPVGHDVNGQPITRFELQQQPQQPTDRRETSDGIAALGGAVLLVSGITYEVIKKKREDQKTNLQNRIASK